MSLYNLVAQFLPFSFASPPISTTPSPSMTKADMIAQRNRQARTRLIKIDATKNTRFLKTIGTTVSTSRKVADVDHDSRPIANLPQKSSNVLESASGCKENTPKGSRSTGWPAAKSTIPDGEIRCVPRDKQNDLRRGTRPFPTASTPVVPSVALRAGKRRASHALDAEGPARGRTAKKVKTAQVEAVGDKRRARDDEDDDTGDIDRQPKKAKLAHRRGILKLKAPVPVPVPEQAPRAKKRLHWCRTVVGGEGRAAPLAFTPATLRPRAAEAPAVPRSQQTPKTPARFADDANAFLAKDSRGVRKMPAFVPARFKVPSWDSRELMFEKLRRMHATMNMSLHERAARARGW
ncbi:hypothetical protein C8Q80DRAFT_1266224 [Daedaleopsis nitida]|nr:hypothetical protein C8Q80DRAFT_1266224 [Daedaleopsis nitida]